MNILKLIETIELLGYIKQPTRTDFLRGITESLNLANNEQWKKYVRNIDSTRANEYLEQDELEKLKTDGRLLLKYPADKITKELVLIAINAHRPLTRNMATTPKIKKHLSNTDVLKQHLITNGREDWLKLWNTKKEGFMNAISSLPEVLDEFETNGGITRKIYRNMDTIIDTFSLESYLYIEYDVDNTFKRLKYLFETMKFPKLLIDLVDKIYNFNRAYSNYDYSKAFSQDKDENETVVNMLKLKCYDIEKIFNNPKDNRWRNHEYNTYQLKNFTKEVMLYFLNYKTLDDLITDYMKGEK